MTPVKQQISLYTIFSGVAIAGSAGSMNPGPRSSGAHYRNNVRQGVSTSHSCKTQVQRDR